MNKTLLSPIKMEQTITNFHEKIRALCKPNPKCYPDPSIQEITWDKNLMNFYGLTFASLTFFIFAIYFKLPFFIISAVFCRTVLGFIIFFIFCQTRAWVFHSFFLTFSFIAEYIALESVQEAVYYHIGHLFISITLIFFTTSRRFRMIFCSISMQICVLVTKFKEKLITCLYEEESEVFAEKLVNNIILAIAILVSINILLVKMLERRTIEVSRARIALENALEQQKTFIFSFSHELRNPINSLLGNLQLVLQGDDHLSKKASEMINTAKICGELLLHNINNVLDTGKHEIGKLELNPVPTHLNELFQRTWTIYSELFRQKKLKSQLRIEKDLPPILKIDSHKVNQILLNLIGNSIKFTEKGSISVIVNWLQLPEVCDKCFEPIPYDDIDESLFEKEENVRRFLAESTPGFLGANEEDDGRQCNESQILDPPPQQELSKGVLKIMVKDTGSGMKPEALEKLFKKFSQVSEDVSQRNIGTGLGLFITKEICTAMNGDIRAYSQFGKGTTFVVCIPTTSVPMTNAYRENSESILHVLATKNLKAIVADDSPFNVNLTCDYFAKFGVSVAAIAYNGYDAFVKYKECLLSKRNVDIVVLDIDMPIMDGRKACDKIREYEKEEKLKPAIIILFSGNYDKEQVNEYLNPPDGRHRADCFLRKPVSFSEFHRTVYSLVIQD